MSSLILAGIIVPICLLVLLAIRVPIAFALFLLGAGGLLILKGSITAFSMLGSIPHSSVAQFLITVVPMFIVMGHFALSAGLAEKAFEAGYKLVGRVRGGLAMGSTFACGLFAACTGSSAATAATIGRIAIPEMEKYGYHSGFAAAAVGAGGTLGILIPPSVILIVYGMITGESIARLLIAGIIPGILSIVVYFALIWVSVFIDPKLAPAAPSVSMKERLRSIRGIWGFCVLILAVLGSMYSGWATPTQAAALGAFVAFLIALPAIAKRPGELGRALLDTVTTTSMVFAIVAGATIFTIFLTSAGVPGFLTRTIVGMDVPRLVILFCLLLFYVPMGMFLDPISILLITVPLCYPVLTKLGYNGIWIGILVTKMIEVGYLTPPLGFNVFIIHGIAPHIPVVTIFKNALRFLIADGVCIVILIAFPKLVTFLSDLM